MDAQFKISVRQEEGADPSLSLISEGKESFLRSMQDSPPTLHTVRKTERAEARSNVRLELCCQLSGQDRRGSRASKEDPTERSSPTACPGRWYVSTRAFYKADQSEIASFTARTTTHFISLSISNLHNHEMDYPHIFTPLSKEVRLRDAMLLCHVFVHPFALSIHNISIHSSF